MQFTTTALCLLAFTLTEAHFGSLALRSASPIHYQPFQARNLGIWLGGNLETSCPSNVQPNCPPGNVTAFQVNDGYASMDTEVPGGQSLYIGPHGSLKYTEAHANVIPDGAYTHGFKRYPGENGIDYWTFEGDGATGFLACKQEGGYKVYADVPGFKKTGCLGFTAAREEYHKVAAWQYD